MQSFIYVYGHKEYIDYIPKYMMKKYLLRMHKIFISNNKRMNQQVIDDLSSLTHIDLSCHVKCNLRDSFMSLRYVKKKKSIFCDC